MTTAPPFLPPADLLETLASSRHPLLIAHLAPDGDAISSLLALGMILYRLGKEPILACQDRVPSSLQFLPWQEKITTEVDNDIDMLIALDSSDASRMGDIYQPRRFGHLPLLVIDHHVTNLYFGTSHWVEPQACATAEMIYYMAQALDVPLDIDLATCLLAGIVTDTRGFRTNNTAPRVLALAATLAAAGAPLPEIMEIALETRSYNLVRLWGRALATVSLDDGVISVVNTKRMRSDLNGLVRPEGLSSFLLSAREAQIAAVFTELPENEVECSFRARPGFDVASLSMSLGGGGHALAAGCTVQGRLDDIRPLIIARLRQAANHE